jgi:predicted GNAT superfamily acetyltransferase
MTSSDDYRIRRAESRTDIDVCVDLQRAVWGLSDLEVTSAIQLIATTFAGGLLHLAETPQGEPVGFAYAFPALRGGPHLHSDMLAVLPDHQKKGLGARLKWAQRADAQARGIRFLTWTFDPLQARNAHLNLGRLGATASEFLENMYGVTSSSLHHSLPTHRLLVHWDLDAPRVRALASGGAPPIAPAPPLPRINEVKWQAGWTVSSDPVLDLEDPELLLEIPPEWNVLARSGPRVAEAWQARVRSAFVTYFARGYAAEDFLPTQEGGRRRPFYLLRRRR